MSRLSVLAILAIAAAGPAWAENNDAPAAWRPQFIAGAKPADIRAAYPKAAYDNKVSGEASLKCVADAEGRLVDCKIFEEEPAGLGFGAAALQLVGKERIKAKDAGGQSVAGRTVTTYFSFLAPGDANPDWIRKPSSDDLAGVFPKAAIKAGKDGRAEIGCDVTVEGFLQNCKVLSEQPEGLGFGPAALQLAPQFRMSPRIRGGKPTTGSVTVPVNWGGLSGGGLTAGRKSMLVDPPWASTPSAAQVAAAWPAAAGDTPSAQVALRCSLDKTGALQRCDTIAENPKSLGFGRAAKDLSKSFRVAFAPEDAKTLDDYMIDIPFRFRNPAAPDTRKLTRPRWIRTLTADGMAQIYPAAALKAGIKSGLGVASCVVRANGELGDCQASREDPAGLEFAAAAIEAATLMQMNPWSTEGDPVEGLRINLPIRFTWEGDLPVAPGTPPAKP